MFRVEDCDFPDAFAWGTATSSHQVEGDNDANDWWEWEAAPGRIRDGSRSGRAAEWWAGRAEGDFERARRLGQNAHRLSLEWSRLEPEPGRFDERAFDRYAAMLAAARASGLKLMVTLNHFTLPRWLARRGAWLDRGAADAFAELARRAVLRLGPLVDLWCTQNEPNVLALMAYAQPSWPPGLGSMSAAFRAFSNLLTAHARAYHAMHRASPGARVGIVVNMPVLDPASAKLRDRAVARAQDWAFSGAMLRAFETGVLLPPLTPWPERIVGLKRAFDWFGVNYYGRYTVEFDVASGREFFGRRVRSHTVHTEWNDWGEPYPGGLSDQLVRLARLRTPLYVTENGIMDASDARRPEFLREHVRAVAAAIARGSDVRGYFHWSLLDNFEWSEGWSAPFGLHALARDTQERSLRPSGELYGEICRSNGRVLAASDAPADAEGAQSAAAPEISVADVGASSEARLEHRDRPRRGVVTIRRAK
jgi:beta-glucosidase